ncbi:MAG: MlaA family lipoprotein, partial [Verrucomicrobia bacterium]|nr:MlaA family lipoprotein [Verrucomicrobiota bacterium]
MNPFAPGGVALPIALAWTLVTSSPAQTQSSVPTGPTLQTNLHQAGAEIVVLPKSVPDPIEPLNRIVYAFNKGLMCGVVKPTAKVYRLIVFKPVRTGIGNIGKNLIYPGRLI